MNSGHAGLMNWAVTLQHLALGLFFVAQLVALAFCLVRWRQHPRASLLLFLSIVISMTMRIGSIVLPILVSNFAAPADLGPYMVGMGAVSSLVGLVSFGLLVVAVYIDRQPMGDAASQDPLLGPGTNPAQSIPSDNPYRSSVS